MTSFFKLFQYYFFLFFSLDGAERELYNLKRQMRKMFRELLEILFMAAALVLDTVRTFYLIVLAILGPIAFGIAVYDGFGSTLT